MHLFCVSFNIYICILITISVLILSFLCFIASFTQATCLFRGKTKFNKNKNEKVMKRQGLLKIKSDNFTLWLSLSHTSFLNSGSSKQEAKNTDYNP
jgi:hypothetical protein